MTDQEFIDILDYWLSIEDPREASLSTSLKHFGSNFNKFYKYVDTHEGAEKSYTRARERRAEIDFELYHKVAYQDPNKVVDEGGQERIDPASVALIRHQTDSLKWEIARKNSRFSDKQQIEHSGEVKTTLVRDYGK